MYLTSFESAGMNNMSVVEIIKHYQRGIEKCQGNQERMLHCIGKLYRLPVTVQHLQDTGIGKTVNSLRKYEGDTGEAAKALVAKWKAMVAAEDSSEGEEPEENHQISTEEEQEPQRQEERHRSDRERSRHDRKRHSIDEKPSSHDQVKKRRYEDENGRSSEKHRRKHETETESSESEDDSQEVEEDSGHESEEESTSQTSQNANEDSSDEEPPPRKEKSSSREHSKSKEHSRSKDHHNSREHSNHSSSKVHNSSRERGSSSSSSKEHSSKDRGGSSSKEHSKSREHSKSKEHSRSKEHSSSSKEHSSNNSSKEHRKHKDKSTHKTEDKHKKDEKQKEEVPKKQKSSSSSSSYIPDKKSSTKVKKERPEAEDDSIDCSMGASFAEALGMVDPVVKKKQHSTTSSPGTSSGASKSKSSSSGSKKKEAAPSKSLSSPSELNLLSPNVKLEPLHMEVDLDATLPPITPNYKPLPHYNLLDSPPQRKVKMLTEEEALSQVMSTKNQRTKVYSGVKSGKSWATVPSLYDICVRVLQENIDALEYTGGVPYDLLKPVLQHATPEQLFMLEHHNPYLIDDTGELWQFHCQKEFRTKQRQDMETWREMYLRCLDEREAKLKALTTNIQQSIAKSTPVRQTKLAYVDSVAKPPRNVARQQAKYGTAKVSKPTPPTPAAKAAARASGAATGATPVPVPVRISQPAAKVKPRMAPLMQKTMKLVKSFKR